MADNVELKVATLAGLSACIILPIPTPEWGDAPISEEQIEALSSSAGRLTSEEIEAELGHPQHAYANDRVTVYEWTRSQGIWIVGVANQGGITAGVSHHRLGLLFSDQGLLKEMRHFDSAISQPDSKVRSLLDDWLGVIAGESEDYGLARYIDVDRYSVSLPPELHNTVGLVALGKQFWSPCEPELSALAGRDFLVHDAVELRKQIYPWLEPPWFDRLDALSSEVAVEETRRALGLRFLVVTMTRSGRFLEKICGNNNPYVLSCYKLEFGSQNHFVALLDLRNELKEIEVSPAELVLPLIPIFPSSEQEACRVLTMYALQDITKRLQN